MKVDMVADMEVGRVANMEVDMEVDILVFHTQYTGTFMCVWIQLHGLQVRYMYHQACSQACWIYQYWNLSAFSAFFFAFCGIFPYLGLEKSMEIHTVGLDIHSIIDSLFGQENLTKVDI